MRASSPIYVVLVHDMLVLKSIIELTHQLLVGCPMLRLFFVAHIF